ncbi:dynein axonemal assembly factor 8-like isoform X2 [Dysidea avara]|uniref:dynein axonemal assembly factor 8-like isoform X2 n=1 Tax=Dysidea avara TaxID=196820 RepID=UPI00331F6CE4
MHVMSQIEDIYKQLGGDLPSADFNLESSEDEDAVAPELIKPSFEVKDSCNATAAAGADSSICTENSDKGDDPPHSSSAPEEDTVSTVDTERKVLYIEKAVEIASSEPGNTVVYSSTTTVETVSEITVKENGPILCMAKLEDLENFMDTLLDSELDDSTLTSQNAAHDAELSVAQPLTDTQLMGELCKLNEKLLPSNSNCDDGKVKEKNVNMHKHVQHREGDNKTESYTREEDSTIFVDLRPQKTAPTESRIQLSSKAKKLMMDKLLPSSSHNGDDSSEDDTDWASYRQQVKSHSFDSSMEDKTPDIPSSPCSTIPLSDQTGTELSTGVQSWSEMLKHSLPLQHLAPVTSLVAETDILEVTSVLVTKNKSQESPTTVSKIGKKSKVRKHAKKKKTQAAAKDQKKEDVSKSKQKTDKESSRDVKVTSGSPEVSIPNVDPASNPSDAGNNVSASVAPCVSQAEDVDKIKTRLEAQINARMGFGAFLSESIIYDKEATFEPILDQTSCSATTNALLTIELDSSGLPVVENDAEIAALKLTKSWLIALFVKLAVGEATYTEIPFLVTGIKQTMFNGRPAIVIALSTTLSDNNEDRDDASQDSKKLISWLNTTTLEWIAEKTGTEVPPVILETVCDEDNLLACPMSDIVSLTEDVSQFFLPISFYWEKLDKDDGTNLSLLNDIETTVAVIRHSWLGNAKFIFSVLDFVALSGLDLAGMRLVYEADCEPSEYVKQTDLALALAIRGPHAINQWVEIVGPGDHELAKVTDPNSLSALYGNSESEMMWFSRNTHKALYALAKWFGGRACIKTKAVFGINDAATKAEKRKWQKVRFADSPKCELVEPSTPTTPTIAPCLFAANQTKIILTVSPKVPPSQYFNVFAACDQSGYEVCGIKRMRLNPKRARMLSLSSDDKMDNFTPSSPSKNFKGSPLSPISPLSPFADNTPPPMPSLMLILSRENAMYHSSLLSTCLEEKLAVHFKTINSASLLSELRITPYSDVVLSTIKSFTEVPAKPHFSSSKLASMKKGPESFVSFKEELSVVCFSQECHIQKLVTGLQIVLCCEVAGFDREDPIEFQFEPDKQTCKGEMQHDLLGQFELLGIKWLPKLERQALQETKFLDDCLEFLQRGTTVTDFFTQPFMAVVFRGINVSERIKTLFLENSSFQHSPILLTVTNISGLQLASLLFASKELFPDFDTRHLSPYLPPRSLSVPSVFQAVEEDNTKCVSILAVKITAFKLFVKILDRLSRHDFGIVGLRLVEITNEMWLNMRSSQRIAAKSLQQAAPTTPLSSQCYIVCLEHFNAVWYLEYDVLSFIAGDPALLDSVYCSHSYFHASQDLLRFFPSGLCCEQTSHTADNQIIPAAVNKITSQMFVHNCMTPEDSPLTEINCIIVPSSVLCSDCYNLASELDNLLTLKFTVVCMEAVCFSHETAKRILSTLSCDNKRKVDNIFTTGASVLIVVKRDNAASCFNSIVQQSIHDDILVPKSCSEASQLMSLLFPGTQ